MKESLSKALQISAIGIGLVFLGILILWAMMEITGRIGRTRKPKPVPGKAEKPTRDFIEARKKAVAAAVITAMALQNTAFTVSSHKNREVITAWQAAHRSHQLRSAITANSRRKKDK